MLDICLVFCLYFQLFFVIKLIWVKENYQLLIFDLLIKFLVFYFNMFDNII